MVVPAIPHRGTDLPKLLRVLVHDEFCVNGERAVGFDHIAVRAIVLRRILRVKKTVHALGLSVASSAVARVRCHLEAIAIGLHDGDRRASGVLAGDGGCNAAIVVHGNKVDASCAAGIHSIHLNVERDGAAEDRWSEVVIFTSFPGGIEHYHGFLVHHQDFVLPDVVRIVLIQPAIDIHRRNIIVLLHDEVFVGISLSRKCQQAGLN